MQELVEIGGPSLIVMGGAIWFKINSHLAFVKWSRTPEYKEERLAHFIHNVDLPTACDVVGHEYKHDADECDHCFEPRRLNWVGKPCSINDQLWCVDSPRGIEYWVSKDDIIDSTKNKTYGSRPIKIKSTAICARAGGNPLALGMHTPFGIARELEESPNNMRSRSDIKKGVLSSYRMY